MDPDHAPSSKERENIYENRRKLDGGVDLGLPSLRYEAQKKHTAQHTRLMSEGLPPLQLQEGLVAFPELENHCLSLFFRIL